MIKANKESSFPEHFYINGNKVSSKEIIADQFNHYFGTVGSNLASNIETQDQTFDKFLNLNIKTTFTFRNISEDEVKSVICGLPPKSSFGSDGISTYLLKFLAPLLWKSLTLIINQSLNSGIFPDKLKRRKINT